MAQVLSKQEFFAKYPGFADTKPGSAARERWLAAHPGAAAAWERTETAYRMMRERHGENWQQQTNTAQVRWDRVVAAILNPQAAQPTTPPGQVPAGTAPPPAPDPRAERAAVSGSARALITDTLGTYGLGGLAEWAWNRYLDGATTAEVFTELRGRGEYKTRFAGMDELSRKQRSISEQEYIGLERQYAQIARAYGLPATFYDGPEDFARLIGGEVAPTEFANRLDKAEQVAATDPRGQRLREELARLYQANGLVGGNELGAVTAYFIDPDRAQTVIEAQFRSALAGSASRQAGFGQLTKEQAERVASTGISEEGAVAAFGKIATYGELTADLPGMGSGSVTRDDLIGAAVEGNAQQQEKVEREQRRRVAQFSGGGGYASSGRGISGLGTAT